MKYSNKQLKDAVAQSFSWMEVERRLVTRNYKQSNSRQVSFKNRSTENGFDYSHFTGQSHAKGKNYLNSDSINQKYSDEEIFCNPSNVSRTTVRRRLMIDSKFIHECEICKNKEWNGKQIPLVLDHINGDKLNQTRKNLRFICPNCDAQTDTYKGRNNKSKPPISDQDILNIIPHCYTYSEVCRKLGLANHGNTTKRIKILMDKNKVHLKSHIIDIHKDDICINGIIKKQCLDCSKEIENRATRCKSCASAYRQKDKSKRPNREILEKMIWEKPTTKISKQFGVSDKAVEKWCKHYDIEKPPRGYWAKKKHNKI